MVGQEACGKVGHTFKERFWVRANPVESPVILLFKDDFAWAPSVYMKATRGLIVFVKHVSEDRSLGLDAWISALKFGGPVKLQGFLLEPIVSFLVIHPGKSYSLETHPWK